MRWEHSTKSPSRWLYASDHLIRNEISIAVQGLLSKGLKNPGRRRTYDIFQRNFYWPHMPANLKRFDAKYLSYHGHRPLSKQRQPCSYFFSRKSSAKRYFLAVLSNLSVFQVSGQPLFSTTCHWIRMFLPSSNLKLFSLPKLARNLRGERKKHLESLQYSHLK